ncbi:MAG: hypothetical protein EBV03_01070 [Proteobacteria bacterium]|nr:hypothetical protein [Pseudomonadota bacterium]
MNDIMVEVVGWVGAALVLGAYGMLSARKLTGDSYAYHYANIVGAALFIFYAIMKTAWATLFVNATWMCIGLFAIYSMKKRNA